MRKPVQKPRPKLSLVGSVMVEKQARATNAVTLARRGNLAVYRHGKENFCPKCGKSHWFIGRSSAECAFCDTALPFAGGQP